MYSKAFQKALDELKLITEKDIQHIKTHFLKEKLFHFKFRRSYLIPFLVLGLNACTSPAVNMTEYQVSQLSDLQLCQLKNSYAYEQKTEIELGKRNLNCHPAYMQCRQSGYDNNSQEIHTCAQNLADRWALEKKLADKERELEFERIKNSQKPTNQWGVYRAPDVIINQY